MKYIEKYLKDIIKVKPLGTLTTKEDELDGISGEMVYIGGKCSNIFISRIDYANWLEKQVPIDEEKVLIGARKDIALSIMNFLDRCTTGMCLSNMECADLESAVVDSDWSKVYDYMKKKLDKQGKQKSLDYENINIQQKDFAPKSTMEAIKEEKIDNTNKVEPKDYNSIDPHFGKPTDKVEPKFYEGEWIVWQNKCYKVYYNGCGYELIDQDGLSTSLEYETVDTSAHLWGISDVKDGDVLIEDSCIFIIQKLGDNSTAAKTYCTLYNDGDFNDGSILYFDIDSTKPATKEQRDTLERAMADAGYTFDFEKKELKKLGQSEVTKMSDQEEIAEIPFGAKDSELQEVTYFIPKVFHAEIDDDKVVIKKGEKPTTWSEEDELSCFESALFTAFSDAWQSYLLGEEVNVKRWAKEQSKELLEAAKEELKGHNSAWSEEDDDDAWLNDIISKAECNLQLNKGEMDWLKSLKDRYTWKPTEEQIRALHDLNLTGNISYGGQGQILIELYNNLKKLTE